MPIPQSDVTFLLEGLMPRDTREFHNPMRGFLSNAAKTMPELPSQSEMQDLVEYSRNISPASRPSAWLEFLVSAWKNTPGKIPSGYSTLDLTAYLGSSLQASTSVHEKNLQKCFQVGDYPQGHGPRVGSLIAGDRHSAEQAVNAYQREFSPSSGVVLPLGGLTDGEYLALAYYNEDVTTSHIFQALKFMGYKLDEQAEAQLEAYDSAFEVDPQSLVGTAVEVARSIPSRGVGVPIEDLHGLHSQPHRYDQEVLDNYSNDIGIA